MFESYKKALAVLAKKPFLLWGLSLMSGFLSIVITIVSGPVFFVSFIANFLLVCGMSKIYLDGLKGKEVNSDQLFACFNKGFLRVAGGMAWKYIWLLLWSLIPFAGIILGIIKFYEYRFVDYILVTKPEVSATQALRLSKKMTYGRKGKMFAADFVLGLAIFVVMFVLGLLSAVPFIGFLFRALFVVVYAAILLFVSIFVGLYHASFYDEAEAQAGGTAPTEAPTEATAEPNQFVTNL